MLDQGVVGFKPKNILMELMTCLVRCPPLVASSAGEGQEVVALPAVSHDVLGPNPPLAAVRAEVDPVLGVATE